MKGDDEWRTLAFEAAVGRLCQLRHQRESRISAKCRASWEDVRSSSLNPTDTEAAALFVFDDAHESGSLFAFVTSDDGSESALPGALQACHGLFEFVDQENSVVLTHGYDLLGKGAHSNVYRGTLCVTTVSGVTRYDAAVKINRLNMSSVAEVDRWMRLVQLWRSVKHPCLTYCYYVGLPPMEGDEEVISIYGAYEMMLGGTLDASLKREERFSEDVVRVILLDVLQALYYLHDELGVVHNDVKPQNILLVMDEATRQVRHKLADFDLMCPITFSSSEMVLSTGPILDRGGCDADELTYGTPPYMSPESCRGFPFLPKNDIWSVGILTYQLSTGRLPWSPLELCVPSMILHGYRQDSSNLFGPSLEEFEKDFCHVYSEELKDLVRICLADEASRRPTAAALLQHPFLRSSVG
ncbi:protein kinase [Trypanosoma rangeli SC58]|uniref:non-specific serine/threonine protein kinase n=1 Tax=Trypanosoma rangeli SC58 TaxID=429131 RepID=A0A061IVB5_TRYRA|nr:protein kinase [Trypanosoma rangeli SC58]